MEGVMMRGENCMAIAVRDAEGNIVTQAKRLPAGKNRINKIPILRGVVNFFSTMVLGVKTLMDSAEVYADIESEPSRFEKWCAKTFKVDLLSIAIYFSVFLGLALSVGLLFILPQIVSSFLIGILHWGNIAPIWKNLLEGGIRLSIFILYILLVSLIKDIRRTFQYHGAEHKTISCFEKGLDLNVENAQSCSKLHNRCGTTFLFFVMVISILVFSITGWTDNPAWTPFLNGFVRIVIRLALLPIVAGISYELLKLLAKSDAVWLLPFKLPGLLLQKLTTAEPEDGMVEVAITAFQLVEKMQADPDFPEHDFELRRKFQDVYQKLQTNLKKAGIEDVSESDWICVHVLKCQRSALRGEIQYITKEQADEIHRLGEKRVQGTPLQYVLGETEFFGVPIKVTPDCLIPRFETEVLCDVILRDKGERETLLDLCTGSGCIAIVAALHGYQVTASDLSQPALLIAQENARLNSVQIQWKQGDLFENIEGQFDVITANPPYIRNDEWESLSAEVKQEPQMALLGGIDGLDYYRKICQQAPQYLQDGGLLVMEHGLGQEEAIAQYMRENFDAIEHIQDLDGKIRIIKGVKKCWKN